jgi:hypothetical protein
MDRARFLPGELGSKAAAVGGDTVPAWGSESCQPGLESSFHACIQVCHIAPLFSISKTTMTLPTCPENAQRP